MSERASTTVGGANAPPLPVRIVRVIDAIMLWSASIVASFTLPLLFVSICIDVIIRYVTKQSISWLSEVQSILFPWLILSGVSIAALWGRHIALDAILRLFPVGVSRMVLMGVNALAAGTFFYLTWIGFEMLPIVGGEVFPVTGLKTSWAYTALVMGFLYLTITSLTNLVYLMYAPDPFAFRWGLEEEEAPPPTEGSLQGGNP